MTKPRVAWVAVEPTPYHLPLMDAIRRRGALEMHYYFCAQQIDQPWALERFADLAEPESAARRYRLRGLYFNPAIVRAIARQRWDAVVFSGYAHWTMQAGIAACIARRIPFFIQSDTQLLQARSRLKRGLKRLLLFPVLRRAAGGMGLGRLQGDYFRAIGLPDDRIFTVPLTPHLPAMAAECGRLRERRDVLRSEVGLQPGDVAGLFVGRLVGLKGLDDVLDGLALLPNDERPRLVVVGDGPLRGHLEGRAANESLPVYFAGFQQHDQLARWYALADFFLLSSYRDAWGIVVAEAAACGLPLCLSDQVGAAYDLLEEGANGWLVRRRDAAGWAAALRQCTERRADLPALGRRSAEIAQPWNAQRGGEAFHQAIGKALGRQSLATGGESN